MKFGMSHYGHKSIPDAKFESDSSSSFGDMTSQNFSRKKGLLLLFSHRDVPKILKMKNFSYA